MSEANEKVCCSCRYNIRSSKMGMTIDDSERYLRLMLDGMEYAARFWKDRNKLEYNIEQTNVEAVKTALDTMRKYQKIEQIVKTWDDDENAMILADELIEVIEDGNDD